MDQAFTLEGQSQGITPGTTFNIAPYKWPDTATDDLQNLFKTVASKMQEEIKNVAEGERLDYIIRHLQEKAVPTYFAHQQLLPATIQVLQDKNMTSKDRGKIRWDHIEKGYYGAHLRDQKAVFNEPLEQEDVIRMWGLTKWAVTQIEQMAKM